MCGIFGIIGMGGKPISIKQLKEIAVQQEARGPHSFGFAWIDANNRVRHFKTTGRISQQVSFLNACKVAKAVIGHTRYATHGDIDHNINNHPHPSDGGWVVHNGVIGNHEDLEIEYDMLLNSECDSEVLAQMIELNQGKLTDRVKASVNDVDTTYPLCMAGLWKGYVTVARRGNPLKFWRTRSGNFIFGSIGTMTSASFKANQNTLWTFNLGKGSFKSTVLRKHKGNRKVAGSGSTMHQGCSPKPQTNLFGEKIRQLTTEGQSFRAQMLNNLAQRTGDQGMTEEDCIADEAARILDAGGEPIEPVRQLAKPLKPAKRAKRQSKGTSATMVDVSKIENGKLNGRPIKAIKVNKKTPKGDED